jgi:hypothetical protein
MGGGATNLPPGFHFFPSDEDLVVHFLRRKAANLPCRPDIVPTILLHRYDPWELNGLRSHPYIAIAHSVRTYVRSGDRPIFLPSMQARRCRLGTSGTSSVATPTPTPTPRRGRPEPLRPGTGTPPAPMKQ